jgi:hypothetical protein
LKPYFTILFILLTAKAFTQAPTYFANTYTIGENNPLVDFNTGAYLYSKNGELYLFSYNGKVCVVGNNYIDSVANTPTGLTFASSNHYEMGNQIWAYSLQGIVSIKSKKMLELFSYSNVHNCYIVMGEGEKGLYLVDFLKNNISFFNGSSFTQKLKLLKKSGDTSFLIMQGSSNSIWLAKTYRNQFALFKYNQALNSFTFAKAYEVNNFSLKNCWFITIDDENNFSLQNTFIFKDLECRQGKLYINPAPYNQANSTGGIRYFNQFTKPYIIEKNINYSQLYKQVHTSGSNDTTNINAPTNAFSFEHKASNSFFLGTANKPVRVFKHITQYPNVYNNSHSNATFSLCQNEEGNIYAGSYQLGLSIISPAKKSITNVPKSNIMYMNGGVFYNQKHYIAGEGVLGLFQYTQNNRKQIADVTGFYTYLSKNKQRFYYGSSTYNGTWITDTKSLDAGTPKWNKIDSTKGNKLLNVLTITEDTLGRAWYGHKNYGIAIYEPKKNNATTWLLQKNETPFGTMSSLTDKWGTVWLGSKEKGLWYYNDYTKPATPKNCKKINNPLLNDKSKTIMSMTTYYGKENYLIMGCYDKICLLNLDSFYLAKKILVRYVNPQEAAFTSFTEQNTMLTSHTDSSIWFSTSDMIYNWDINTWLALPKFTVAPTLKINSKRVDTIVDQNAFMEFSPYENSFQMQARLLSPDLLPRYINLTLVKDGDSASFEAPNLQTDYAFNNLSSGKYTAIIRVCQSDGSISYHNFYFIIKKFIWQQWWFWAIISLALLGLLWVYMNQKTKRQVAEQEAKNKALELLQTKTALESKIANLQLVSLGSQFRPHFILNALNTVSAQMWDKPEAEKVLGKLGESIEIIFNHSKEKQIFHSFANEWKLVDNIISIHQSMYLKNILLQLPPQSMLDNISHIKIPMGLLQIPVENALLHGLSNKENPPHQLTINFTNLNSAITIEIIDDGVGRKKAATLTNFTKHGTGTKNLNEILAIVNDNRIEKFTIEYIDEFFDKQYGTKVIVNIPKT